MAPIQALGFSLASIAMLQCRPTSTLQLRLVATQNFGKTSKGIPSTIDQDFLPILLIHTFLVIIARVATNENVKTCPNFLERTDLGLTVRFAGRVPWTGTIDLENGLLDVRFHGQDYPCLTMVSLCDFISYYGNYVFLLKSVVAMY